MWVYEGVHRLLQSWPGSPLFCCPQLGALLKPWLGSSMGSECLVDDLPRSQLEVDEAAFIHHRKASPQPIQLDAP